MELVHGVNQGCIKPTTDYGTLESTTLEKGKLQTWCMVIIFLSHLEMIHESLFTRLSRKRELSKS